MFGEYTISFDFKMNSCWYGSDLEIYEKPYRHYYTNVPPLPLTHLRYEDTIPYVPEELIDYYDESSDESEDDYY